MDWRNWNSVVDASSFMLFEFTGDSEADSDLNMVANSLSDDNMEATYNEVDDALSCCSETTSVPDYNDDHDQESKKKEQNYAHYDYNPRYKDDEDDDAIDQDWTSTGKEGFVFARKNKSHVYEDSSMVEPMKKEEKDKLFWETCLAS